MTHQGDTPVTCIRKEIKTNTMRKRRERERREGREKREEV